jgi:hypothetical protein
MVWCAPKGLENSRSRWSLDALCGELLKQSLEKSTNVRMGNWEAAPLSREQQHYACADVWSSMLMYHKLLAIPVLPGKDKSEIVKPKRVTPAVASPVRRSKSKSPSPLRELPPSTTTTTSSLTPISEKKENRSDTNNPQAGVGVGVVGVERVQVVTMPLSISTTTSQCYMSASSALSDLPASSLQSHVLFNAKGMSVAEICKLRGLRATTVESHLADAIIAGQSYRVLLDCYALLIWVD